MKKEVMKALMVATATALGTAVAEVLVKRFDEWIFGNEKDDNDDNNSKEKPKDGSQLSDYKIT